MFRIAQYLNKEFNTDSINVLLKQVNNGLPSVYKDAVNNLKSYMKNYNDLTNALNTIYLNLQNISVDTLKTIEQLENDPWDFEEFSDVDYEWTEHESLEDFGFDSNEIGEELYSMRSEFIEKYLNEELNKDLYNFKVPFNKKDTMNIDEDGNLIFEEGDKNILPPNR